MELRSKAGIRVNEMLDNSRAFCGKAILTSALLLGFGSIGSTTDAAELLMIEEDGCFWCEAWDKDVAEIYPKTFEGKMAPLRRVDIHSDLEDEIELKRSVHFTPTFLLVDEGRELSRIEGYPGEDFFWGLLEQMIKELPTEADPSVLNTSG